MKKTTTSSTKAKKTTAKKTASVVEFEPKNATLYLDIRNVNTDEDMVYEIASAKVCADRMLSTSEAVTFIQHELELMHKLDDILVQGLFETNNSLYNKLKWAKRPWYKKLMFWKKNPNK